MTSRRVSVLVALALGLSACGGADASSTSSPLAGSGGVASLDDTTSSDGDAAEPVEVDAEAQMLAFAQCLRDQGFDVSDPTVDADGNVVPGGLNNGGGGEGGRPAGFGEAREVCSEFLEGVTLGRQNRDLTESLDQQLEFTACMRDNGFDLPDPDPGAGGGRGVLQDIDRDDPAYQAAFENCSDILGGAGN